MTLGVPKTVTRLYHRINPPPALEKQIFKAYARYLRFYVKTCTRYNYDRKNPANLYPLKLLWINPQEIEYGVRRRKLEGINGTLLPRILDGDWDQEKISAIEERTRYRSMNQHFREGLEWEKTELYQKRLNEIHETGSTKYGGTVTSQQELDQVFENIDTLYQEIKENGYKTQREIRKKEKIVNAQLRPDHYANELNEVIIDIGRNGELLFHENRHRLYIAKILGLEKIPVRVLVRHSEWQKKRNLVVEGPETLPEKFRDHPDIEYLI